MWDLPIFFSFEYSVIRSGKKKIGRFSVDVIHMYIQTIIKLSEKLDDSREGASQSVIKRVDRKP